MTLEDEAANTEVPPKEERLPKGFVIRKKKQCELEHVLPSDFKNNSNLLCLARYLYWACFRGNNAVTTKIIDVKKISPFFRC